MKPKNSNVLGKVVIETLLQNGFEVAAGDDRQARPTSRQNTRETRGTIGVRDAFTSNSGKSVYLKGINPHSGRDVTVFLSPKGHLTPQAVHTLQQKTGLSF